MFYNPIAESEGMTLSSLICMNQYKFENAKHLQLNLQMGQTFHLSLHSDR